MRLLYYAKKNNPRLFLMMQTICSTGIRVSELKYITVESLSSHEAGIYCKGKMRKVFLPKQLCGLLKTYSKENGIKSGPIFVTSRNNPIDRSNLWAEMKSLCAVAHVNKNKVFPHNLRHLFAKTFYSCGKDIVRLSDILGHSSIDTTRIYTMESGDKHNRQIQKLGLIMKKQ